MAYFVAKTLHMKPMDILNEWNAAELAVAYGEYANEISMKNYEEWKSWDSETRNKYPKPKQYNVRFFGVTDG